MKTEDFINHYESLEGELVRMTCFEWQAMEQASQELIDLFEIGNKKYE